MDHFYDTPRRSRPREPERRPWNPAPLCLLLALLLGGLCLLAWQLRTGTALDGHLKMPDVVIGGVDMSGMTKEEAKEALQPIGARCESESMIISIRDEQVKIRPDKLGIRTNTDAAVDAAYETGASGQFDLLPYLGIDEAELTAYVNNLAQNYSQELVQTQCAITGTKPDLSQPEQAEEHGQKLAITVGSPSFGLDTKDLLRQLLVAYSTGVLQVSAKYQQLEPSVPDLETLYRQTYIAPVDAVLDEKTFVATGESYGYAFDLERAQTLLAEAEYGETLYIPFRRIDPQVTAAQLTAHLYRDILGTARTPYKGKDTDNRNVNLDLACKAINGLILLPGESFSYNETLGERTAKRGYMPAPSYESGKTVDTYGGGICQVSSTLYYSTLFADLKILERHNHGYLSDYIDPGMDATVTWGGVDFRFENNTDYPIRIDAWRSDGYVNVNIVGTETRDYYVKMSYHIFNRKSYDTVYEEHPENNKEGYYDGQVLVTPYSGASVRAYKEKYDRQTDEMISREEESYNTYKKRDKVICKIVPAK